MKKFLLFLSLVLTQVLGDICLSRGMKEFGAANLNEAGIAGKILLYLFTNHWIWLGVGILIGSSLIYLVAVSRFDVSYVLPIHAFSYVLNALMAWAVLGEQIPLHRWLSTILITIGVFCVGISDRLKSQRPQLKNIDPPFWFWFPFGFTFDRSWLAIFILALGDATGDLSLAMGMKRIGPIKYISPKILFKIITNPLIILGICGQALAFANFVLLLSWENISFVRPASALTYIFSLLGAKFILKEIIVWQRFLGIAFIGFGILIHS